MSIRLAASGRSCGGYWIGGRFTADAIEAKWLQTRDRLLGRHAPAAIVAVSAAYGEQAEEAYAAMEAFLAGGIDLQAYLAAATAGQ